MSFLSAIRSTLHAAAMKSLTVQSPAKINLFLKILGKRRDGYHEIVTLFHRISLADTLILKKIPSGIRIRTNVSSLPTGSRNILWKAFHLLGEEIALPGGVSVNLKKQIPIGAGLGGGSSNAASFLLGFKRLYRLRISKEKLLAMGAKLGADVNFFLLGVNQALGWGAGEKLSAHLNQKRLWFVLVAMPASLPTRKVYRNYRPSKDASGGLPFLTKGNRVVKLPYCFRNGEAGKITSFLVNDLQETSARFYPPIRKTLRFFEQLGVRAALMSGSGPTVFAVMENRREALRLRKAARKHLRTYKKIFISHTW